MPMVSIYIMYGLTVCAVRIAGCRFAGRRSPVAGCWRPPAISPVAVCRPPHQRPWVPFRRLPVAGCPNAGLACYFAGGRSPAAPMPATPAISPVAVCWLPPLRQVPPLACLWVAGCTLPVAGRVFFWPCRCGLHRWCTWGALALHAPSCCTPTSLCRPCATGQWWGGIGVDECGPHFAHNLACCLRGTQWESMPHAHSVHCSVSQWGSECPRLSSLRPHAASRSG